MSPYVLTKWGLYSTEASKYLAEHNKQCYSAPKNRKYLDRDIYRLSNNFVTDCRESELKLKYINNRLGTNIDYAEALSKKIVLNLGDVLGSNYITEYTRDPGIIKQMNDYFVGFISSDNAFVNMRKIVRDGIVYKSIDKRYIRYNIFGKYDNTEKFYIIPTQVNVASPERLKINVAEGEFDALSVYYNLRKDPSQVYIAIGGSGYVGLMRYILTKLKLYYIELHLYPDNDKTGLKELDYVKELLYPYGIPIYVHRNVKDKEKDFGVTPDRIIESVYQM